MFFYGVRMFFYGFVWCVQSLSHAGLCRPASRKRRGVRVDAQEGEEDMLTCLRAFYVQANPDFCDALPSPDVTFLSLTMFQIAARWGPSSARGAHGPAEAREGASTPFKKNPSKWGSAFRRPFSVQFGRRVHRKKRIH